MAENLRYQRLSVGLRQAGEGKAVPVGRQLRGSPGLGLAGVTAFQGGQASASGERTASATMLTGQQERSPLQSHQTFRQHVLPRQTPGCQVIL